MFLHPGATFKTKRKALMKNRSTKTEQPLSYLLKCDETARTYLNILNQFATANGLPFETEHQQRKVLNLYERSAAPKN